MWLHSAPMSIGTVAVHDERHVARIHSAERRSTCDCQPSSNATMRLPHIPSEIEVLTVYCTLPCQDSLGEMGVREGSKGWTCSAYPSTPNPTVGFEHMNNNLIRFAVLVIFAVVSTNYPISGQLRHIVCTLIYVSQRIR